MPLDSVHQALKRAVNYSLDQRIDERYWSGEVHSNTTFTSEYIFLRQTFNLPFSTTEAEALTRWLFSKQNEDGSWGLAPNFPGDVSTTTETYLALKILGILADEPRMLSARNIIINSGGLKKTRMFMRIFLASFGLIPWASLPSLPAELILLPLLSPVNVYHLSSWARATCIPLLIVRHHEPVYRLSTASDFLEELRTEDCSNPREPLPYSVPIWAAVKRCDLTSAMFSGVDRMMCFLGRYFNSPLRCMARSKIVEWIINHQEKTGEWAGYWPPQHYSLWALTLEGFEMNHPVMRRGFNALKTFIRHDEEGVRVQVTVSQVWDTALMAIAIKDSASSTGDIDLGRTVEWLLDHEVTSFRGDWRMKRPNLMPGGFCFEEFNTLYPDVDDTAAAVIALIKSSPAHLASGCVLRATRWILGMQNNDGGWAAFDWNNDKLFLNKMPFSDMDSLCDPSTADVTGRIIECFGIMLAAEDGFAVDSALRNRLHLSCKRAVGFLLKRRKRMGRGGGDGNVDYREMLQTATEHALQWLKECQTPGGGWGESPQSYSDPTLSGRGPSTAPQTAWALMALLKYLPPTEQCIKRGVAYLVQSQVQERGTHRGTWPLQQYTATGFPGHLYLEYGYYRHYFPMMALGRYASKMSLAKKEGL